MKRALLAIILVIGVAAVCLCQDNCQAKIKELQKSASQLDRLLRAGTLPGQRNLAVISLGNISTIDSSCIEASSLNALRRSWSELKFDLDKGYTFPGRIRGILTNHIGFFGQIDDLKMKITHENTLLILVTNLKDSLADAAIGLRNLDTLVKSRFNVVSTRLKDLDLVIQKDFDKIFHDFKNIDTIVRDIRQRAENERVLLHMLKNKNSISAGGYSNGLYSLGYGHIFSGTVDNFPPAASIGLLFPINSSAVNHAGAFGMGGFYHKRFVLQAGIGYLNRNQYNDISWMGSVEFYGDPFALGIKYSPLTGLGLKVSVLFSNTKFRFKRRR